MIEKKKPNKKCAKKMLKTKIEYLHFICKKFGKINVRVTFENDGNCGNIHLAFPDHHEESHKFSQKDYLHVERLLSIYEVLLPGVGEESPKIKIKFLKSTVTIAPQICNASCESCKEDTDAMKLIMVADRIPKPKCLF